MIELTANTNDRTSYERVEASQEDHSSSPEVEQMELDEENRRSSVERAALAFEATMTAPSSSGGYPRYNQDVTSSERLFVNLLGLGFLLASCFFFEGVHMLRIPFLNTSSPNRGSTSHELPPRLSPKLDSNSPSPTAIQQAAPTPTTFTICPPPTKNANDDNTFAFQEIYHNRFSFATTNSRYGAYLSADASIMVWTEPLYHRTIDFVESGRVRTFGWDCEAQTYREFEASLLYGIKPHQRFGINAQLSDNGKMLLVQSGGGHFAGAIRAFRWSNQETRWVCVLDETTVPVDLFFCHIAASNGHVSMPIFSMNRKGTAFAVMTAHFVSHLSFSVYRWENEEWKSTEYSLPLAEQRQCQAEIGITISEDAETVTLYGLIFGILQARVGVDSTITPIDQSALELNAKAPEQDRQRKIQEQQNTVPPYGRPPWDDPPDNMIPELHVSATDNILLYSLSTTSGDQKWISQQALIEYRDDEWVTLYTQTANLPQHPMQMTLQSNVALMYDRVNPNSTTVLFFNDHEWKAQLLSTPDHDGGGGAIQLSGNGAFLSVVKDDGNMYLYSLKNAKN
jgi:hypothetical protein